MEPNKIDALALEAKKYAINKGPNLLGAIIILVAGFILARVICRLLQKWLERRDMEPPVRMLLTRVTWLLIMALFFMVALGTMGIAVGPLIALMSVAGVGIGLAMQGVLGNLVSGLVIIFTKPFRVGEYIAVSGNNGQVNVIELFSTTLLHPDKSRVVVPNRKIVGEIIHNYGTIRQADLSVSVAYGTDLNRALEIITEVFAKNPRVLKDPTPIVGTSVLGDSSIAIAIKPWSLLADFGPMQAEVNKAVVEKLRENGIEIPFPQREIRLLTAAPNRTAA